MFKNTKLLPIARVLFLDVNIPIVDIVGRNLKLDITTSTEIYFFAFRQLEHQLFNKCRNVLIGDDITLPTLNAKELCRHFNFKILLNRCLA